MSDTHDDILQKGLVAALELAAEQRWDDLTLSEIANRAGLTLDDFHGRATKQTLADYAEPYFDRAMTREGVDMDDTPRERLFDVIMLRFEAMEPYRDGLKSLMAWRERSPLRIARQLAARRRSAEWALIAAGLDGSGPMPSGLRAIGVAWAMAQAEYAWRKETDPGFARTMAALDKELRKAEERQGAFARFTGQTTRKRKEDEPAAPSEDEETQDGASPDEDAKPSPQAG